MTHAVGVVAVKRREIVAPVKQNWHSFGSPDLLVIVLSFFDKLLSLRLPNSPLPVVLSFSPLFGFAPIVRGSAAAQVLKFSPAAAPKDPAVSRSCLVSFLYLCLTAAGFINKQGFRMQLFKRDTHDASGQAGPHTSSFIIFCHYCFLNL
jgi:hypothetical protein